MTMTHSLGMKHNVHELSLKKLKRRSSLKNQKLPKLTWKTSRLQFKLFASPDVLPTNTSVI